VASGGPNRTCRTWIEQGLAAIAEDGKCVGTCLLDWDKIEEFARRYVARKTAEGRYARVGELAKVMPTWDLLEGKEIAA